MKKVAKFEKVSLKNWESVFPIMDNSKIYKDIKLPKRATKLSAGYDFFAPYEILIKPGENGTIPTGIRVKMLDDYVLLILPRSGLGFKYRLQLDNTVGVIDADYYHSDNEGHIFIKITNDSREDKIIHIKKGEAFAQGIFLNYGITEDDEVNEIRNGGLGSTSKVKS